MARDNGAGYRDYFISRAGADSLFAIWVGRLIAAQGKTYILQDEHFGHENFMAAMDGALKSGARVVALLTQAYLDSDYCLTEATAALKGDPLNRLQRLIALRLEPCAPGGVLANLPYVSLLEERREHDWAPLAFKVLRALGFDNPSLEGVPPPPAGTLAHRIPILHPEVAPMPQGYAPRTAVLDAIAAALAARRGRPAALTNAGHVVQTVAGMAGVGKSVLAREFAWRHREDYEGVWWIAAETRQGLLAGLAELGARLSREIAAETQTEKAARRTLEVIEGAGFAKPWLLVYDNVEGPRALDGLTPRAGAHVLVTTRRTGWDGEAAELPVDVFRPQEAVDFLLAQARKPDREAAARLARDLGYLPLALAHARALAWSAGWDFETYRGRLPELIRRAPRDARYPGSVFATFDLAIAAAGARCPEAETLMGLFAFLAPERIPLDLVGADVMDAVALAAGVGALAEVSLLTHAVLEDGSAGVSVHRLVQEVMKGRLRAAPKRLESADAFAAAAALATRLVADAFPFDSDDPEHWPRCRQLQGHAMALLAHAPDQGAPARKTVRLLNLLGVHLAARADHAAAEPLYRRALAIDERSFGPEHPNVATSLNNLAQLLKATNRLAEAEPLYRRALAIDETSFGPEHPNVARDLNNLAQLLQATNRLAEAEPLMRRALAIDETSFGPEHPEVATDLNNLAGLLQATNRLAEAEPLYRRALAIDETSFGPEHPKVAIRLNNLAQLLQATNRLAEAEPLMRRALAIVETTFGPEHPSTRTVRGNLALLEAALAGAASPASPPRKRWWARLLRR